MNQTKMAISVINHGLLMGGEQLERDKLWDTEYRTIRA
jgi:hypothetical protein